LLRDEQPAAGAAKAVESADGSTVAMIEGTLSLGGLWCQSCAWLIRETLRRVPGVVAAEVSLGQREARLTFDPARTTLEHVAKRVRRLGYRAVLPGERPHDEEYSLFQRLLFGGLFTGHDMIVGAMIYGRELLGWNTPETAWLVQIFQGMMFLGAIPIVLVLGIPVLRAGIAASLRGRPNTHSLIALGTLAAFILSVRNLFLGSGGIYFDTVSMLLFLVTLGRWFEVRAHKQGTSAVARLERRVPARARWVTAQGEQSVEASEMAKGARVRVFPGERFPVDGIVIEGEGEVDESLLTGEATPVMRRVGERVLAGTANLDGTFELITTATGPATVAGQIGRLLHEALWQRAPVERLADRLSAIAIPVALVIAGGTFAYWWWASGPEAGLLYALSVLLIACPCALGLATPLTLWSALGQAAERGVILRGTAAVERLAGVRQIFFDKTGTLTSQAHRLHAVAVDPDGADESALLARAAAVEARSEHPLAQAIVVAARERGLPVAEVTDCRLVPGQGVVGAMPDTGTQVWVGNRRLVKAHQAIVPETLLPAVTAWQERGLIVLYAGWEGRVRGLLGLGETIRPEAETVVRQLREMGHEVAVLTGDDVAAGRRWERRLGVPVHAQLLPEEKVEKLRQVEGEVAMVGDGINDGPALAAATVGIALRHGTDVARAAADAVLVRDHLAAVPWLLTLGRQAKRRVRQNLAWAFAYNIIGIGFAASGHLQPILAAAAMVASSLIVTGNARRRYTP
jgi:copper-transporting P-type ATPase V